MPRYKRHGWKTSLRELSGKDTKKLAHVSAATMPAMQWPKKARTLRLTPTLTLTLTRTLH